jgi:hypothetical protein
MEMGADKALCLKLGYTAVSLQQDAIAMSREVGLACQCLLQIYKCSHEQKLQSFRYAGATELIPLLSQVLKELLRVATTRKEVLVELDDVIHQILAVLRVFSKLTPAKSILVTRLQSALLGHLANDALVWIQQPHDSTCYFSPNVFWETLGLLKDLTFRSEPHDKTILLCANGGILYHLLSTCCRDMKTINLKLQEWCTAVVWNLALDPATCERLISRQASDLSIVHGLLEILMHHSVNGSKADPTTKIKRNAVSALGNFVVDSRFHHVLFQLSTDTNALALLPRLMNLVEGDCDSIVRRRAMRAIRCLVSSPDPGVKLAVRNENLPERFLASIIGRNTSLDDENDHDTQIQACQAVIVLSESMQPADWTQLQDILTRKVESTTDTKLVSTASLVLTECIKSSPCNIGRIGFSDLFWKRLENAVLTDHSTHDNISCFYFMLAQFEQTVMQKECNTIDNPSILTCASTINAMTSILSAATRNEEKAAQNVLESLRIMMQNISNKKPLAENESLLSGLVNLCLANPRMTTKECAKQLVLQLIPEI